MTARRVVPLLAGALIGLTAFVAGLGLEVANPLHTSWLQGDHRIHYLGWHMFGHEDWQFPPGRIVSYGYPVGTSIAYTDSIPLLAFPFKLVRSLVGVDFQYLGAWLLVGYVLQGVFGVLLLRRQTARVSLQLLGCSLFVMSPPFLLRYGHPALSAHWILLAGLYIYFAFDGPTLPILARWALVGAVAAATHPYLAMMVVVLAAAHHGRLAIANTQLVAWRSALAPVVIGAVMLTVFWLTGYFVIESSSSVQGPGLGVFSMNALAPIMPTEGPTLFSPGPFRYATLGQYEGYAYLGGGVLLLSLLAPIVFMVRGVVRQRLRRRHAQHVPLVLACALLVLMALSPTVTAGGVVLFEYDERWWGPLTVFRASGRMFWPVFYLLVLGVVTATVRWFRFPVAAAIMATAVGLQVVDLSAVFSELRSVRRRVWDSTLSSPLWSIVPQYRHLVLVPTNMCALPPHAIDYEPFALLAGRAGVTINAGFAARFDVKTLRDYCTDSERQWRRGDVRDDELYVVRPGLAGHLKAAARAPVLCVAADDYQVCFTAESYRRWQHTHDLVRQTLVSPEEVARFHATLETIYREDLQRPPTVTSPPMSELSEWVVRYLAYRSTGCTHDEGLDVITQQVSGANPLRLCRAGYDATFDMPPPNETLQFRRALEQLPVFRARGATAPTHLDAEGQVVWLQEYTRLRRSGRTEGEAFEQVRAAIHRAAGR